MKTNCELRGTEEVDEVKDVEGVSEGCLICSRYCGTTSQLVDFFEGVGEAKQVNSMERNSHLNPHLAAIFLLKRVLHFPRENCESLLKTMGGIHPGEWFKLCDACFKQVKEVKEGYQLISLLKIKIAEEKRRLAEKIEESIISEGYKEKDPVYFVSARDTIRLYFRDQVCRSKEEVILPHSSYDDMEDGFSEFNISRDHSVSTDKNYIPITTGDNVSNEDYVNTPTPQARPSPNSRLSVENTKKINFSILKCPALAKDPIFPKQKFSRLRYKCSSCSSMFGNQHLLRAHWTKAHQLEETEEVTAIKIENRVVHKEINFESSSEGNPFKLEEPHAPSVRKMAVSNLSGANTKSSSETGFYHCGECNVTTSIKEKGRHITKHKLLDNIVPGDSSNFRCKLCSTPFKTQLDGKLHLREVHGKEIGLCLYKCSHCDKMFNGGNELRLHIQRKHDERKACCDKCGAVFNHRRDLLVHCQSVHSRKTEPVICDICGRAYVHKKSLQTHKYRYHGLHGTNRKVYLTCSRCGHQSGTSKALTKHVKTVHINLYIHQCRFCPTKFIKLHSLLAHEKKKHSS